MTRASHKILIKKQEKYAFEECKCRVRLLLQTLKGYKGVSLTFNGLN